MVAQGFRHFPGLDGDQDGHEFADMTNIHTQLAQCVEDGRLLVDADAMEKYLCDWTRTRHGKALAVARPTSTAQVSALMKVAAANNLVVTPQGGNTGLTGASVPRDARKAIVISLDRMTAIRSIDTHTPSLTAEAGCILATLQDSARNASLCLPLGLGAEGSCTLGGVVSTNAGGIRALRYGNCRENVMGLEAVMPDGSIWNGLRALRKHNMGFDLKQLLIGSEGTLGIVTAAVVRLTPAWRQMEAALVAVPSPAKAMIVLERMRRTCGDIVVACELIQGFGLDLALTVLPDAVNPLGREYPWYVLLEVGTSAELGMLRDAFERALADALEAGDVLDAVLAESEAQRMSFWRLREGVVTGQRMTGSAIKTDVSVPVGAVPEFIECASQAALDLVDGARPLSFGHVGDGNIHFTVIQPEGGEKDAFMIREREIVARTHDIALALGGSISAEHGIGLYKRDEFERVVDPVEMTLFRQIKSALDPEGRMNPGVLLRPTS
jgi:FAD/FMN-containing dehydrogenase